MAQSSAVVSRSSSQWDKQGLNLSALETTCLAQNNSSMTSNTEGSQSFLTLEATHLCAHDVCNVRQVKSCWQRVLEGEVDVAGFTGLAGLPRTCSSNRNSIESRLEALLEVAL